MDKIQLRRQIKSLIVEYNEKQRMKMSKKACRNLVELDQFRKSSVVMMFLSLPHEVDTTSAILYAWQQEKTVVVPKVSFQQRHMIPVEITSLETGFSIADHGLRNPITGMPVPLEEIDLVVTPGLAFDRQGNRLGRGGSYYDRFFDARQLRAVKCGLAFNSQVIDSVPINTHDKQVDFIVTEKETIYCKQGE